MSEKTSSPIKLRGFDEKNCPICYEEYENVWAFPCGHMICEKCYLKQKKLNRICHMCREKYNLSRKRKNRKKNRYVPKSDSASDSWDSSVGSFNSWNGWDSAWDQE